MKKRYIILSVIIPLWLVYLIIAGYDSIKTTENIYPRYVIGHLENYGTRTGHGNVIALSPYLHPYDFSSEASFQQMLHYYLSFAQQKGLLNDSTVVVLPEYIGTWLVTANEKKSVFRDTSIQDAMKTMAFSNVFKFGFAYATSFAADKQAAAIFRMKAALMCDIYQRVFASLAKDFHITIVAGSIVLPNPDVKDGKLRIRRFGALQNVSVVFAPDGKVLSPLTRKVFPIEEELAFTKAAKNSDWPIYTTPAGKLAVAICADAWYPSVYQQLSQKGIDILAVPSFVGGYDTWSTTWKGYNGAAMPKDIVKTDVGSLTEREAWLKYSMMGRLPATDIPTGINVFLRGNIWNMGTDGHTLLRYNQTSVETEEPAAQTGSLINCWIE